MADLTLAAWTLVAILSLGGGITWWHNRRKAGR